MYKGINVTGVLQHNVIAFFVVVSMAWASGGNPVFMFPVALVIGIGFAWREAGQRMRDFPWASGLDALVLNWTGPDRNMGFFRAGVDEERSRWDWRLQGYAPTPVALGGALLLMS